MRKNDINEERKIPGRQKVVHGSNAPVLTLHVGMNPRLKHASLSLSASLVSSKSCLVTSAKRELSRERVVLVKKSLGDMQQKEFNQMLEKNGHQRIKEAEDTIFCKVFFEKMPDDCSNNENSDT